MGTTQRIVPGVSGEPNWGNLNKSITNVAKTLEKEKELDSGANSNLSPDEANKQYQNIRDRRQAFTKSALSSLIRTGGGSTKISKGGSSSIGRAGLKSARRFAGFISSVSSGGLQAALSNIGFGTIAGKSVSDVIDFLLAYCSESSSGMDETAANKASCEMLREIAEQVNTVAELETLMSSFDNEDKLEKLTCNYFGVYIFEHLSQRFEEKITQIKGTEISRDTFKTIKDYIIGSVALLNTTTPISRINWQGDQGKIEIERMFESVIKIFE